ncbi:MAG: hypothetical protein AAF726_06785 [Planctomycetota bacterium]
MAVHLKTATPAMEISDAYFERLGFTRLERSGVYQTDGSALIEVDPNRFARPGLVVHRETWDGVIDDLAGFGPLHDIDGGRLLAAPSGTWCYLLDGAFEAPPGFAEAPPSILGSYAGISLETTRIADSQRFWELLGFTVSAGGAEQGWVTLSDETGTAISLVKPLACPHLFVNPSLTYFNGGKNPAIIEEIRRREVPIVEEVTAFNDRGEVDNVILREPGGIGAFIFND